MTILKCEQSNALLYASNEETWLSWLILKFKMFCYASFIFETSDNPNAPILILLHLNVPENTYWLRIFFSIQETHMQMMF